MAETAHRSPLATKTLLTGLYTILRGIDAAALEQALREQTVQSTVSANDEAISAIALDGQTLRGSIGGVWRKGN